MIRPKKKIRVIGRREQIFFPDWNVGPVEAKIDTGAYTGALHADDITESGNTELSFVFKKKYYPSLKEDVSVCIRNYIKKPIRNSFGEEEVRYCIPVRIHIGKKIIRTFISLTDRSTMKYPVILGRRVIKNKFWIDVSEVFLNGKKIKIC
jgi:hypothetical protein